MHPLEMIDYWAKIDPHRLALVEPDTVITYGALADSILSIESRVVKLGLDKREPIAVSLATPSLFVATVLALLRAGYDTALVNPRRFPLLQATGIRNLIYDSQGLMLSGGRNIRFDKSWLPNTDAISARKSREKLANRIGDTIFFTSGTTGLPKKVVQTDKALQLLLNYPITCASGNYDRILIMPGLSSTLGFNRACEVLAAGKTALFAPTAEAAVAIITRFDVEVVVASAAQALTLGDMKKRNPTCDLAPLKAVYVAGGKVEAKKLAELRASICRHIFMQYGSTEAGVVTLQPTHLTEGIARAVGTLLPWVEMEIVDETGQTIPAGNTGTIRYRTPQLLANLENPGSSTVPGIRDGWFYPGDVGSLSADGLLCLEGRTSDVINRAGVKISGTRIEEILQELPQIKEAAACGVTGSSGIEEVWVAVVPDGQMDIADLKRQLEEHDDVRISPDQVFVLDALPRGELGKIQKHRLRELLQNMHREN
jgi:acyl-coenzyme A synthetase/AMP-(fatty) acid ligase